MCEEVFSGCFFASGSWIEIYLRIFDKLFLISTLTRDYSFNLLNGKFDIYCLLKIYYYILCVVVSFRSLTVSQQQPWV